MGDLFNKYLLQVMKSDIRKKEETAAWIDCVHPPTPSASRPVPLHKEVFTSWFVCRGLDSWTSYAPFSLSHWNENTHTAYAWCTIML